MSKFTLNYHKTKPIVLEDLEKQYVPQNSIEEPFSISGLQCYNPIYNSFFEMSETNYDSISLNHRYHVKDLTHVLDTATDSVVDKGIFIKFAPLLDPVRYLIGRYKSQEGIRALPTYKETTHDKLANPNNASYIDNFFCYLSSQLLNHHDFLHGVDYYGSFLGIQKKFKMNLADDMDYLVQSDYFNQQKGKLYELEQHDDPFANFGSRNNKNKLAIHNESNVTSISLEVIEELQDIEERIESYEIEECVYEKSSEIESDDSSNNSEVNYSSDDDDDDDDDDEDDDDDDDDDDDEDEGEGEGDEDEGEGEGEGQGEREIVSNGEKLCDDDENISIEEIEQEEQEDDDIQSEEVPLNGYIYDFPVQMICLEKCTGTLDQLFAKRILDIDTAASALFQVIMVLYAYQKSYYFTHNDLHTNNIMFVETEKEFLYYKVNGKYYKVPTYGRIFKLIDFGRAIYRFQGKTFCSDSFAPGGDAATQYNFGPFFNEKKPRLEPNYSFDLCRLGCSIYDFLLDIEEENDPDFVPDRLQSIIMNWVRDDHGKNVLYMKNGEERYPNFKLYKMIARTVHNKTPECQMSDPLFGSFVHDGSLDESVVDLDALPSYV
jgi:hypothetical protein